MLRRFLSVVPLLLVAGALMAQTTRWRAIHDVKKKETLFGIAQTYGVTVDDLKAANPEMEKPGYKLKKGDTVFVPFPSRRNDAQKAGQAVEQPGERAKGERQESLGTSARPIRLGIMLPLHNINGDGRRMVEYYRGVLMACDSLKQLGVSIDIHAWNVPENGDLLAILNDPDAAQQDMIIGPLYSKQMRPLSEFVSAHNILLMIPFSINAPELYTNRNIFQVYQNATEQNEATVRRACDWFKDYHPVIIDCNDSLSNKGTFTSSLRRELDVRGVKYRVTSLTSSGNFMSAFSMTKPNLVVLNSARLQSLNSVMGMLSSVSLMKPEMRISMLGYTDWLLYANRQMENMFKYDVYVPSTFYTNLSSDDTRRLQQKYRWNFHQDMMATMPRFALTGFDHAFFFLSGLKKYGKRFDGATGRLGYQSVQTPLKFERIGNGGLQNRAYMFVHYKPDHTIETINY